jgi:CheY-like chemotaxis protein
MDAELMDRLFKPFEGDSTLQKKYGGTGLGLVISKRLAEIMAGEIEVESTKGEGSIFRFTIPTPVMAEPPEFIPDLALETVGLLPFEPHVLLVEDEILSRQVAIRMLQKLGCRITCAQNGSEALLKFGAEDFDLVVMDCQMPDMDGFETTRIIRRLQEGTVRTPIVALTAEARESDRKKCLEAGMDDHLVKPVRLQAMRQVVEYWLRRPEALKG